MSHTPVHHHQYNYSHLLSLLHYRYFILGSTLTCSTNSSHLKVKLFLTCRTDFVDSATVLLIFLVIVFLVLIFYDLVCFYFDIVC